MKEKFLKLTVMFLAISMLFACAGCSEKTEDEL